MGFFWNSEKKRLKEAHEELETKHFRTLRMIEGLSGKMRALRSELTEVEKPLQVLESMDRLPKADSQILSAEDLKKLETDHEAAEEYKETRIEELRHRQKALKAEIQEMASKSNRLKSKLHGLEKQLRVPA